MSIKEYFPKAFCDHHPDLGVLASLSGFGTSILSFMSHLSVIVGFAGAVFGCVGGYYTFRIQRQKWIDAKNGK